MRGVRSTLRIGGSWVREPRRRSPGRGVQPRWLGARRSAWLGVYAPCVRLRERPNPEPWWRELWRRRNPREHRRSTSAWPGVEVVAERTPGGSKASKRACRLLTGEPSVGGKEGGTCGAPCVRRGDRSSDRGNPSSLAHASWVRLRTNSTGKELARKVKATVKFLPALRWRRSSAKPARKQRPARAGTAPREGKALEGAPGMRAA